MIIDILCRDGSPLGVTEKSIGGNDGRLGIGGAELALLTMCAAWKVTGNDVRLFNDPKELNASSFEQLPVSAFDPNDNRDVLIIFRSPNPLSLNAKGFKTWWSCDQYTIDSFKDFAPTVQKIVTISKYHADYFKSMYGITDTVSIDLPVRTWEYKVKKPKVSKRCIFTSMPDRGLMNLHAAWPLIVREVPDASLVITSDWRLWDAQIGEQAIRNFRLSYAHHPNVEYLGAVKRDRLIQAQLEADVMLYPCIYEELFCIAVSEAQVAGVFPITSGMGALPSTNMGTVISGSPNDPKWVEVFVHNAVSMLNDPKLCEKQSHLRSIALKRFSPETILKQWDKEVFGYDTE